MFPRAFSLNMAAWCCCLHRVADLNISLWVPYYELLLYKIVIWPIVSIQILTCAALNEVKLLKKCFI